MADDAHTAALTYKKKSGRAWNIWTDQPLLGRLLTLDRREEHRRADTLGASPLVPEVFYCRDGKLIRQTNCLFAFVSREPSREQLVLSFSLPAKINGGFGFRFLADSRRERPLL